MLDCLTSEIMEAYEAWYHKRGVAPNTISFYTRILGAVYNRAVEDDIIENRNPFEKSILELIRLSKGRCHYLSSRKSKALDLSKMPPLSFARDMFLTSFFSGSNT